MTKTPKVTTNQNNQDNLRDWLAGQALVASQNLDYAGGDLNTARAAACYAMADEMMKVRDWSFEELHKFIEDSKTPASGESLAGDESLA
jgi:hypothetical protein